MGILTKEVEVRLAKNTAEYYKNLGYEIPMRKASERTKLNLGKEYVYDLTKSIIVKIEDLPNGSHALVEVLCDYCRNNIVTMTYKDYNQKTKKIKKCACINCRPLKMKESNLLVYNVEYITQLDEVKKLIAKTNMERYGGVSPTQNSEVLSKRRERCIERYGVDNPMKSQEVREKLAESYYKSSCVKCSKQQLYIYNIYNIDNLAELNYPVSCYNIDICLPKDKLAIEFDGGGHDLRVKFRVLTQEEFNEKEIIRDKIIKSKGYKQMRIISIEDLLPKDVVLLQMLQDARNYFSQYPNHSWIEFNIDTSTVRNAENKNGIPYNYGSLNAIKDSDIQNIEIQQSNNLTKT